MNGIHMQRINQYGHANEKCQNCGHCVNHSNDVDPSTVTTQFVTEYYTNVSNNGWNAVQYLFDHGCIVMCKEKHVGNAHDLLNLFSSEFIKRANYGDTRTKWILVDNANLLITVFGYMQFVNFNEVYSRALSFSETFILSLDNGIIKCIHHVIDFDD